MFDLTHVIYTVISALLTVLGLLVAKRYAKDQATRDKILQASSIITVIIHYSSIWVDFFTNGGNAEIEDNQILMVYPCNIIMWFLLIVSLSKKKDSRLITMMAEFVFLVGSICGIVGIVFNANYQSTPNLLDYDILKGLLSHSTMVFGCLYLYVGGYVRIRMFNALSCLTGLLFFVGDGFFINTIYDACGIDPVNAMFMREPLFPEHPWISIYLLGALALLLLFGLLALYEEKFIPKDERWHVKIKQLANKVKQRRNESFTAEGFAESNEKAQDETPAEK